MTIFNANSIQTPPHIRMILIALLRTIIKPGDFMIGLNLEDVTNFPDHLGYLWFNFKASTTVLTFGISTAPLLFTRITKPIVQYLHRRVHTGSKCTFIGAVFDARLVKIFVPHDRWDVIPHDRWVKMLSTVSTVSTETSSTVAGATLSRDISPGSHMLGSTTAAPDPDISTPVLEGRRSSCADPLPTSLHHVSLLLARRIERLRLGLFDVVQPHSSSVHPRPFSREANRRGRGCPTIVVFT
ncbi:uncharacterized protein LOC124276433 [Haliotis rubra]|uniref:uncharacterized protein LOC124276433 n=1 Tax=Haliotis rubra TaxID=36100 RepID=UPI001EE5D7D8|nr:uncharacterized protein LOC124276433 [Haliotis rubra]